VDPLFIHLENLAILFWRFLLDVPNSNLTVIQSALPLNHALVGFVMIWTFVNWAIVSFVSQ
jgi:hypothetical protein